jgi:hypothetical protein
LGQVERGEDLMMVEYVTTLTQEDVGQSSPIRDPGPCPCCKQKRRQILFLAIGPVQERDVGKRVYRVRNNADNGWVLQVENDEQRKRRI